MPEEHGLWNLDAVQIYQGVGKVLVHAEDGAFHAAANQKGCSYYGK